MPNFYVNLMISWESLSRIFPEPKKSEKLQNSLSQSLWHNSNLKMDDKSFYDKNFADVGFTVADCLMKMEFCYHGKNVAAKMHMPSTTYFKLIQIVNSIPRS